MHVYWATLELLQGAFAALQASSRPTPAGGQPVWIHECTGLGPIQLPNYPRPPPCDADPWTSALASRSGMLAPRTPHYRASLMTPPSIIMAGVPWSVHLTGVRVEAIIILSPSKQAHHSHRAIGAWSYKESNEHVNATYSLQSAGGRSGPWRNPSHRPGLSPDILAALGWPGRRNAHAPRAAGIHTYVRGGGSCNLSIRQRASCDHTLYPFLG